MLGEVGVKSIRDEPANHSDEPANHSRKRERFGRLPDSVANSKRLTLADKAVYAGMGRHAFKDGHVYLGQRKLAEYLGTSQASVSLSIQELIRQKHVTQSDLQVLRGKRANYRLLSNIFQPREKKPQAGRKEGRPTVRSAARMWAEDNAHREVS